MADPFDVFKPNSLWKSIYELLGACFIHPILFSSIDEHYFRRVLGEERL
jgi:hypothetical protein